MKPLIVWPLLWLLTLLIVIETLVYCFGSISGLKMLEAVYCTQIGARSAAIAWAYMFILLKPGMLLGWIPDQLDALAYYLSTTNGLQDINKYHRMKWLMKPLVDCEICCCGQISFWWYVTENEWAFSFWGLLYTISIALLFMSYATWTHSKRETP